MLISEKDTPFFFSNRLAAWQKPHNGDEYISTFFMFFVPCLLRRHLGIFDDPCQCQDAYLPCACSITSLSGGRESGAGCHDIIHKKNAALRDTRCAAGMHLDRLFKGSEPFIAPLAVQRTGMTHPSQGIGTAFHPQVSSDGLRQKGGLVESAPQQPAPVQGYGNDQHVLAQNGSRRSGQPRGGRPDHVVAIPMFESENQLAPVFLVNHGCTTTRPRARNTQTFIAEYRLAPIFAGQGGATSITTQPRDKRRIPPAWTAQTEIGHDLLSADYASRRIDQTQCGL